MTTSISRHPRRAQNRRPDRATSPLCLPLETRLLLDAAPPASLVGDVLVFYETAASLSDLPPNAYRFVFSNTGKAFTLQDLIFSTADTGTYTYVINSPSIATATTLDSRGPHTIQLDFATPNTGVLHIVNAAGHQDGYFVLMPAPIPAFAPADIHGAQLDFTIYTGTGSFSSFGSYRLLPSATDNSYTIQGLTAGAQNSAGTANYTLTDPSSATFAYHNDTNNFFGTTFLSFTSATGGLFYNTDATTINNLMDFNFGTFTYSPTPVTQATSIALLSFLNPAPLGANVTFNATVTLNTPFFPHNPSGLVTFMDGTTALGSAFLNSQHQATFSTSTLTSGSHSITATYAGDSNFPGCTSSPFIQVIAHSSLDNQGFIIRIYNDIFFRAPDGGSNFWLAGLNSGQFTPADVATAFLTSTEYRTQRITSLYQSILHRNVDSPGLTAWLAFLASGHTLEEMKVGFFASDEFFQTHGSTNASLITAYYQAMLNRSPEPAGLAYWANFLNAGTPGAEIATAIQTQSSEGASAIVTSAYQTYLHRTPDPAGLAYWTSQLQQGGSELTLLQGFISSTEYFDTAT